MFFVQTLFDAAITNAPDASDGVEAGRSNAEIITIYSVAAALSAIMLGWGLFVANTCRQTHCPDFLSIFNESDSEDEDEDEEKKAINGYGQL